MKSESPRKGHLVGPSLSWKTALAAATLVPLGLGVAVYSMVVVRPVVAAGQWGALPGVLLSLVMTPFDFVFFSLILMVYAAFEFKLALPG